MKITAKYYNIIRDIARKPEETLELPGETSVAEALTTIARRYGPPMERLLLAPQGGKSIYLSLFLNGQRLADKDLSAILGPDDELLLMPAIAGGLGNQRISKPTASYPGGLSPLRRTGGA